MRWTRKIWTLVLLLAAAAGCKQQCFITECDYQHYRDKLAGDIEYQPDIASGARPVSVIHTTSPTTIFDPDRKVKYLSLAESISIALEQGTVGSGALNGTGVDNLVGFNGFGGGGALVTSDHIRVLSLNPALAGTNLEGSLSRFDAVYISSLTWNTTDQPIGTALQNIQAGRTNAIAAIQQDQATYSSQILKPLPTGGVAGITFSTQYTFTNLPARVNPSYQPILQFQFEQPLLQGFGTEINQLRQFLPGSILTPGFLGQFGTTAPGALTGQEGIIISRIRIDQERAQFESNVNQMLLNVEIAYWNLYNSYWTLYARELGLRLAYESWKITGAKYYAGQTKLANFARTRGQYELFRGQRIQALGQVLENERQLRKLLGMVTEDGCRLVPSDSPTLAPYQPDYCASLNETIALRPELIIARENLKLSQLDVINSKNLLLPDLRFTSTYDINALGTRLDGPGANNAFRNLAADKFNDYSFGLRFVVPVGYRQAHANLRRARLSLARSYALLKDQEIKAEQFLAQSYRRLFEFHEQIRAQRAQREAYGLQLRLEFERVGEQITADDTVILEAERFYTDALAAEYNAIAQYNNALATFEYAKGTLQHHNNVAIAEGPLPACAAERAVVAEKERTKALVLAKRKAPVACCPECARGPLKLPNLPADQAVALPSLIENSSEILPGSKPPADLDMPRRSPAELLPVPNATPPGNAKPVGQTGMGPASGWTPRAELSAPGAPAAQTTSTTPPPRPEQFGASTILPPSPLARDSAPSLMSDTAATPARP